MDTISTTEPVQDTVDDCWNKIGVWGRATPPCPKLEKVIHCRNCEIFSGVGRHLLDRPSPPDYVREWTELIAEKSKAVDHETASVLVFRVGDEWLALPTGIFREVSQMRPVHRIPHRTNQIVCGLANVRGELLIYISMGRLLGIKKGKRYALDSLKGSFAERLLVIEKKGHRYVFPVSEIYGIHRYLPAELHEAPTTIANASASFVKGIITLEHRHVGCLDEEVLFNSLTRWMG
jgi:chemotaxis-related protein WspD